MKGSGILRNMMVNSRLGVLWLMLAVSAPAAFGQADGTGAANEPATTVIEEGLSERSQSVAPRLKVGMSLEEALEVVGKSPDSQSEIGAACGKLDVLTWDDDGTRLISVDGTISSVVEGGNRPEQ